MPSYKAEIVKRFGKYHYSLWKAGEVRPEPTSGKAHETLEELLAGMKREVEKKLAPDDPIIFRQAAYTDRFELFSEMKRGEY
ncbi:MAG: hypothetical protein FJ125_12915 [Deltaproteobacteria bacterium]|nr:hypothetical protein [Deltaproteobacteria bacterium]